MKPHLLFAVLIAGCIPTTGNPPAYVLTSRITDDCEHGWTAKNYDYCKSKYGQALERAERSWHESENGRQCAKVASEPTDQNLGERFDCASYHAELQDEAVQRLGH